MAVWTMSFRWMEIILLIRGMLFSGIQMQADGMTTENGTIGEWYSSRIQVIRIIHNILLHSISNAVNSYKLAAFFIEYLTVKKISFYTSPPPFFLLFRYSLGDIRYLSPNTRLNVRMLVNPASIASSVMESSEFPSRFTA